MTKQCICCGKDVPEGKIVKGKPGHNVCKDCKSVANRWMRFGLPPWQYFGLLNDQDKRCAICAKKFKDNDGNKGPVVDHCHRTKQIRGLLCKQCNSGIGYLKDSVEMLEKAILYLNSPRKIAPSFNGDVYTLMKFYFQGKFREKKEKEEVS